MKFVKIVFLFNNIYVLYKGCVYKKKIEVNLYMNEYLICNRNNNNKKLMD